MSCKIFVQAVKKTIKCTFAPLLFGPADLGNIIMLCQVVQVTIEILQSNEKIKDTIIFAAISLFINLKSFKLQWAFYRQMHVSFLN